MLIYIFSNLHLIPTKRDLMLERNTYQHYQKLITYVNKNVYFYIDGFVNYEFKAFVTF